ncbi:MAG TPA: pyridoxal 5'-phosphate synthase glutaminase subunit PdxT [Rhodospirillaceae bacterium]|nr:pyridoxal 5'-phosphate synthase glutaminase subunit PdxT [Rhodospirillaceae bacterium]
MHIGILALQGAVTPHFPHLNALGVTFTEVRAVEDLLNIDGLILPGGESSTMLKLIDVYNMKSALADFFKTKPAWGICAGTILMAREVSNPAQFSFNAIDIAVVRNGYGSQLDSFHADINEYPVSFIRAPVIDKIGKDVGVKAEHSGHAIWVEQGNKMATAFHPELTPDYPSPMHQRFLELVQAAKG